VVRGAGSGEGVEDSTGAGGARSTGIGVVGEGGGDVFGGEMYIACRTEWVKPESTVESVVDIEG